MLDLLRSYFGKNHIQLDVNFQRDLNWFQKFLPQFNDKAFFVYHPVRVTIELDACLQGLGAVYMNQVYSVSIAGYCQNLSIVHIVGVPPHDKASRLRVFL